MSRLFEELKHIGLYDNSLIIVTSDHGDAFMEHGFIAHAWIPYEELIRVPLIVKFPHSRFRGNVLKNQVRLIDVMPTILDLLNIGIDVKLEGVSLLNLLDESRDKDNQVDFPKYAISEVARVRGLQHGLAGTYPKISIRSETLKYLHFQNREEDELYDLRVDPQERHNVIDSHRTETEEFRRMALEMVVEGSKKDIKKVSLDKETIEELKALGYIE